MTAKAIQRFEHGTSETVTCGLNLVPYLQSSETISTIVGCSMATGGPTLSSIQRNSSAETMLGETVPQYQGILFTSTGGTAGASYTGYIEFTTSTSNTKDVEFIIEVTAANGVA